MELRNCAIPSLFEELKHVGVPLDEKGFEILSKSYDTPEEMALDLSIANPSSHASVLPLISELWRRLCPERYTISLFGKEWDYLIEQYENETLENAEDLYQALAQLQNFLEENSDENVNALELVQEYVDYDLETFLYIFILNEIELGEPAYARDLLEGFFPFIEDQIWFEYLLARVTILEDLEEGFEKIEDVIGQLKNENNLDLNLEILHFLAERKNHLLFLNLALQSIDLLETEEDFLDFAEIVENHYKNLEINSLATSVRHMLDHRPPRPLNMPFSLEDPDLLLIHKILHQKIHVH